MLIVSWGISKTVLEVFWTWPSRSIFTFECRIKWSPNATLSCSFFRIFFSFIYFDGQFRPFSFFDSNTYSDAEISIISLRFGGLEITLVWFSQPVFTRFSLSLHFTFFSLTVTRVAIFNFFFRKRLNSQSWNFRSS